jgi:hypothetical protein
MILQTAGLSPSQKAAIEDGAPKSFDAVQREDAVLKMRHHLSLLDLSQRRKSIEEWMASLMGDVDAELTA